LPALTKEHDDLINETFLSLTKYIRGKSQDEKSNDKIPKTQIDTFELSELKKLAITILKRRIADYFRSGTTKWWNQVITYDSDVIYSENSYFSEKNILYIRMLKVCFDALGSMPREDRDLIAFITGQASHKNGIAIEAKPLTSRERQRLRRIRLKLLGEIKRELGFEVSELLNQ